MLKIFSKIFPKKSTSVLGVDIGSSAIKLVQLKKKGGRAVLETYGSIALGPYAEKEIGQSTSLTTEKINEALQDLIREAKVSTKKSGVALPFHSSLMSVIEMPDVPEKEMAQMIPIEARKYIPAQISEVALDWFVIPGGDKDPDSKKKFPTKKVLVVAIHNSAIEKFQDIVVKSELDPKFFEIEVFSAMRSVLPPQQKAPVMFFDIGSSFTKLFIVERGIVQSSHTVNKGSQDITDSISKSMQISFAEAEKLKRGIGLSKTEDGQEVAQIVDLTLSYIMTEADRVLKEYERKQGKTIQKIILVGGGSALKGLGELVNQKFGADVSVGNAFENVETPAFVEGVLKNSAPDFTVSMGLALRYLQELE